MAFAKAEAAAAAAARAAPAEMRRDGDADLKISMDEYRTLRLPSCTKCGHFLKPGIVGRSCGFLRVSECPRVRACGAASWSALLWVVVGS